jgi:flagellar protein FlgJ
MEAKLQRAIAAAGGPGAVGSVDDNSAVPATTKSTQPTHVRNFQEKLGAHAEEASRTTGIPAKFMLGQAALESGWGKREIKGRDGTNSHNLFGIKAGGDWKGKVVEATTTEYVNGKAQTRVERFRAYDSYSDSFKDYGKLLASNPRYEKVLASAGDASSFAQGLQKAGYATDPHYASKLTSIIKRSLAG